MLLIEAMAHQSGTTFWQKTVPCDYDDNKTNIKNIGSSYEKIVVMTRFGTNLFLDPFGGNIFSPTR